MDALRPSLGLLSFLMLMLPTTAVLTGFSRSVISDTSASRYVQFLEACSGSDRAVARRGSPGTTAADHGRALVVRSLSVCRSIAVGAIGAVLLAAADNGAAEAAETQLVMASADAARGRALFVSKGCVACHAINQVGGTSAPPLDAEGVLGEVDPLDFVARMWRGAEAMIFMQQRELGEQLDLSGQELADLIAFAHDPAEQRKLSAADVPPDIGRLIRGE
jgi:mono/diheme cytochrome c family protein